MELKELINYVNKKPDEPALVFHFSNMREKIGTIRAFTAEKALVQIETHKIPVWLPIETLHPVS